MKLLSKIIKLLTSKNKNMAKKNETPQENTAENTQENAAETTQENTVVDIFAGMKPKEKAQVISEMSRDYFHNSHNALKKVKEQLNLFDETHPVCAAIIKNETLLGYIEQFEKELENE